MTSSDKEFVAATIQAIGRCASNIEEVTESCMNGLMGLMSNRDGMYAQIRDTCTTFQEISWNPEIWDRKKELLEKWNSVSR